MIFPHLSFCQQKWYIRLEVHRIEPNGVSESLKELDFIERKVTEKGVSYA